jgi:hypothetical protein
MQFSAAVRKYISSLLLCFLFYFTANAQDYTQTQNRIKSIYVYNFIKDIQWPSVIADDDVQICLLQKNDFFLELEKVIGMKKVNNKKLSLLQIDALGRCEKCDLIFLEEASKPLKREAECSSLIVTSGFYDRSLSNIVLMFQDNKLQFFINQSLCDKFGIKVSSHLSALANPKIIEQ